jgi:uncharacterized radical SAM superfamily Fe-S cluster-containing enzyme
MSIDFACSVCYSGVTRKEEAREMTHEQCEKLFQAAREALEFMERVESIEHLENGGEETIPEVESFRVFIAELEEE